VCVGSSTSQLPDQGKSGTLGCFKIARVSGLWTNGCFVPRAVGLSSAYSVEKLLIALTSNSGEGALQSTTTPKMHVRID
jgi:hypothetical protein